MLRYVLLGGTQGPVPPTFFAVLGLALLGAAGLDLLLTFGSTFAAVGELEALALGLSGVGLLGAGAVRRRRTPRGPPPGP